MKQEFLSIRIVHASLGMGALLFFLVVYFMFGEETYAQDAGQDFAFFKYLTPILVVSGLLLSRVMDRARLGAFKTPAELSEKLVDYRSRVVLRSALIEGPTLFAVIGLLLTGDKINALYFAIGWLALLYVRPYMAEFVRDYKLSVKEEQEMMQ